MAALLASAAGGEATLAAYISTPLRGPQSSGYVAGRDLIMGQFGWADGTDQQVFNSRYSPQQSVGYIVPQFGNWNLVYCSNGLWYLRAGFPVTVMTRGNYRIRFAGGAYPGQTVYASLIDGSAISGYSPNAEATTWKVITGCDPNGFAYISTWSTFT